MRGSCRCRSMRLVAVLAFLCAACGEAAVMHDLLTLSGALTHRFRAQTNVHLGDGVLTVMFQNSQYGSLASGAREKFAWDAARFAYAHIPARDSVQSVNIGFVESHGGMGLTFSRTEVPYGWDAATLTRGGARVPPIGDAPRETAGTYDDPSCEFVRADAHTSADTLLRDFLERDGRGEFLRRSAWLDSATMCPGHLPAPDQFIVVGAYSITPESRDSALARYRVVYQHLGYASAAAPSTSAGGWADFQPHAQADTLHFVLVRSPHGWRVAEPQLPQYVVARSARPMLVPAQRPRLDSMVRITSP